MKRITLIAMATLALTGCTDITFLYPIYEKSDLAPEVDLSGEWSGKDNGHWRFTRDEEGGYQVEWWDKEDKALFEVHLVRISNGLYLDFASKPEGTAIRGHAVARVEVSGDLLHIAWIDSGWLGERLEKDHALAFERPCVDKNRRCMVVTASTADLQTFLMRYAQDSKAFEKPELLRRVN
ncbi:MAG: membrane lipoprotein lipid attachment site-containing protein [Bryobacterales bacterium]|nr:membrane lipoprotein lipid attachment site-containing protein [Bryobacterales bacterium]